MSTATAGVIALGGGDPTTQSGAIIMGFAAARAVGTTTVSITSPTNALLTIGSALWQAALSNGSGTLTISTLTNNNIVGTFSFTLTPQTGTPATGTKTVTNGSFNLTF